MFTPVPQTQRPVARARLFVKCSATATTAGTYLSSKIRLVLFFGGLWLSNVHVQWTKKCDFDSHEAKPKASEKAVCAENTRQVTCKAGQGYF